MYSQEEKDKMAMKNSAIDKFGDRYGVNDISPRQEQRIGRIAENNKDRASRVAGRMIDRNTRVERGQEVAGGFNRTDRQNARVGRIEESDRNKPAKEKRAAAVGARISYRNDVKENKPTFAEKKEAKMEKRQGVGAAVVNKLKDKEAVRKQALIDYNNYYNNKNK